MKDLIQFYKKSFNNKNKNIIPFFILFKLIKI
jgi:hypothetical protein